MLRFKLHVYVLLMSCVGKECVYGGI